MPLNIAVIGTGRIGTTLARRWHSAGLSPTLASRTPGESALDGVPLRSIDAALAHADIAVTAIPGAAMPDFLSTHSQHLGTIPLIDATNTVGTLVMHHASLAGGIAYYRAFNTIGVENFEEPVLDGITADLFYSGPSDHRSTVEELITAVGLRPVWVGDGPQAADLLDGLTRIWFALAIGHDRGRRLAFRMLP